MAFVLQLLQGSIFLVVHSMICCQSVPWFITAFDRFVFSLFLGWFFPYFVYSFQFVWSTVFPLTRFFPSSFILSSSFLHLSCSLYGFTWGSFHDFSFAATNFLMAFVLQLLQGSIFLAVHSMICCQSVPWFITAFDRFVFSLFLGWFFPYFVYSFQFVWSTVFPLTRFFPSSFILSSSFLHLSCSLYGFTWGSFHDFSFAATNIVKRLLATSWSNL